MSNELKKALGLVQECLDDWPYAATRVIPIMHRLEKVKELLLKEQEAVEPINSYGTFRCGNCRNIVGYNDGYGCGYQNNFCSKCGRAVKWE